jgi:hypothetical protein
MRPLNISSSGIPHSPNSSMVAALMIGVRIMLSTRMGSTKCMHYLPCDTYTCIPDGTDRA